MRIAHVKVKAKNKHTRKYLILFFFRAWINKKKEQHTSQPLLTITTEEEEEKLHKLSKYSVESILRIYSNLFHSK